MCISKGDYRRHIGCTQNATAGEEHRRGWHPERFERAANADREVLVVGAGPAGMECALVLGRRGMRRVRLVDAADEPGGITRWIPRLPGLAEWDRLRTWRLGQLEQLQNVDDRDRRRISMPPGCARPAPTSSSSRPAPRGPATAETASPAGRSPGPTRRCRTSSCPSR